MHRLSLFRQQRQLSQLPFALFLPLFLKAVGAEQHFVYFTPNNTDTCYLLKADTEGDGAVKGLNQGMCGALIDSSCIGLNYEIIKGWVIPTDTTDIKLLRFYREAGEEANKLFEGCVNQFLESVYEKRESLGGWLFFLIIGIGSLCVFAYLAYACYQARQSSSTISRATENTALLNARQP